MLEIFRFLPVAASVSAALLAQVYKELMNMKVELIKAISELQLDFVSALELNPVQMVTFWKIIGMLQHCHFVLSDR